MDSLGHGDEIGGRNTARDRTCRADHVASPGRQDGAILSYPSLNPISGTAHEQGCGQVADEAEAATPSFPQVEDVVVLGLDRADSSESHFLEQWEKLIYLAAGVHDEELAVISGWRNQASHALLKGPQKEIGGDNGPGMMGDVVPHHSQSQIIPEAVADDPHGSLLILQKQVHERPEAMLAPLVSVGCTHHSTGPQRDSKERAKRRYLQLQDKGIHASLGELLQDIRKRDLRDQNRKTAPLKPAKDAILIDTTKLTIKQVVHMIIDHYSKVAKACV